MPDDDGVVSVPEPVLEPSAGGEENEMAVPAGSDKFHAISEQSMATLSQSGAIAQNNFIMVNKAQDFEYLEGKALVNQTEAMGASAVQPKSIPGGPSVNNVPTTP